MFTRFETCFKRVKNFNKSGHTEDKVISLEGKMFKIHSLLHPREKARKSCYFFSADIYCVISKSFKSFDHQLWNTPSCMLLMIQARFSARREANMAVKNEKMQVEKLKNFHPDGRQKREKEVGMCHMSTWEKIRDETRMKIWMRRLMYSLFLLRSLCWRNCMASCFCLRLNSVKVRLCIKL